jgi:thioredoxin
MANQHLRVITRDEFNDIPNGKGLVVVDLWADWCGPCRLLTPFIEKFAADLAGRVTFVKLNFDENRDLQEAFELPGIPTLLCYSDGKLVYKHSGYGKYEYLYKAVGHYLHEATGEAKQPMSEAEQAFATAAQAAEDELDAAAEPIYEALDAAYAPLKPVYEGAVQEAKSAFEAGTIDEAEKDRRIGEAGAKVQEQLAPAKKVYSEAMAPVEAKFAVAIHAAAETARSTTSGGDKSVDSEGEATGAVCSIDDPNCRA